MELTKKQRKAIYDRARRERLGEAIRDQKRAAYAVYGPLHRDKEREIRKARMPKHVEYCRRPEYRAKKSAYDRRRKLSRFGEFSEAFAALEQLQKEIRKQMPDRFDRYAQSGRKMWNPIERQRRRNGNPVDAVDSY